MTSPTLPACIPTATQQRRLNRRRYRAHITQLRRKQFYESLLLFVFFTILFAAFTIAAFS